MIPKNITLGLTSPEYSDITLEYGTCWVTVHNLSVRIVMTVTGVEVAVYPEGDEQAPPLGELVVDYLKGDE